MAVVLAATSYSRGFFSLCIVGNARRVMVPGGSTFHLELGTIYGVVHVTSITVNAEVFFRWDHSEFLYNQVVFGAADSGTQVQ